MSYVSIVLTLVAAKCTLRCTAAQGLKSTLRCFRLIIPLKWAIFQFFSLFY